MLFIQTLRSFRLQLSFLATLHNDLLSTLFVI